MSEAAARLVYGNPFHVERDNICRRLIRRIPDYATRCAVLISGFKIGSYPIGL